ncbi:MAG: hypothetical protein CME64_15955 [Halobacteriovoraceae bacterium]|nr:hypothetical protein [Halobacteriovoraceae bacterium]|tara:strand:- start:4810 stop:7278 length:2469 start_codon:yes stop_codon:yes gene_type:complete
MIIKNALTILALCFFAASAAKASYVSYPDFVQMPREKKIEVIEMVQDYIVESEYQSRLLLKKHSPKYTWWDKAIQSFNAYAAGASAVENPSCMYGGWLSVAYKNSRQRLLCSNPKKIRSGRTDYERKARLGMVKDKKLLEEMQLSSELYQDSYDNIKKGEYVMIDFKTQGGLSVQLHPSPHSKRPCQVEKKGDIICNPTIFGAPEGKPLCVPGDENKRGFNSSYLCQQAVKLIKEKGLGEKTKMENGTSKVYNDMMDVLISKSIADDAHRKHFLNNLQRMYNMCMCARDADYNSNKNVINQEFAQKMFNTRTCVGVLNQSREVLKKVSASSCNVISEDDGFNWDNFLEKALVNLNNELDVLDKIANSVTSLNRDIKVADPFNSNETLKIHEIRTKAIEARRPQSYCHVDLEVPKPKSTPVCNLSIGWNEDKTKAIVLDFQPNLDGASILNFKFSSELSGTQGNHSFNVPDDAFEFSVNASYQEVECQSNTLEKPVKEVEYSCELAAGELNKEGLFPIEVTFSEGLAPEDVENEKWSLNVVKKEKKNFISISEVSDTPLEYSATTRSKKPLSCAIALEMPQCEVKGLKVVKEEDGHYWSGSFEITKADGPQLTSSIEGVDPEKKKFKIKKDTDDQATFVVELFERPVTCSGTYERPEEPEEKSDDCSIELAVEQTDGGVYVRPVNAMDEGKEVDLDDTTYGLQFFNMSKEPEEETTEESEDILGDLEMVDAEPEKVEESDEGPSGLALGLEEDNSVFIENSKEDQEIMVLMTTPKGCEAKANKTVKANKDFKLDPKYKQPNLQNPQMNPIQRRRGGFLMRGTR